MLTRALEKKTRRRKEMRVKKRDSSLHPDPDQSELRPRPHAAGSRPATAASGSDQSSGPRERLSLGTRLGSQGAAGRAIFFLVFFLQKNTQQRGTRFHWLLVWSSAARNLVDIGSVFPACPAWQSLRPTAPRVINSQPLGGLSDMLGRWHQGDASGSSSRKRPTAPGLRRRAKKRNVSGSDNRGVWPKKKCARLCSKFH